MTVLIVIITLAGLGCLAVSAEAWWSALNNPAPGNGSDASRWVAFGLPALGIALLVIAVKLG